PRALRPRLACRVGGGAAGVGRARRAAPDGARSGRFRRGRPPARRNRRCRLDRSRRGGWLPARASMSREQVYGQRQVRELWATERAVKSEAWLRELERPRVQTKLERDISEEAGARDHQGVLAWCEPYKYADAYELAERERPLLACLDQVSDPRNLGAVCRSAEGA